MKMPKAYWIVAYRSISDPVALASYAKISLPAIQAGGGKILTRGTPAKTFENGLNERTVVVEFDSVAAAIATYESDAYKAALKVLGSAADRDLRIVEGVQ
jgi:uncharacterized protein (DUF1330 family)